MVDFLNWPALRDAIINSPTLQDDFKWLLDVSKTIDCEWLLSPEAALEADEVTGELHLTQSAKVTDLIQYLLEQTEMLSSYHSLTHLLRLGRCRRPWQLVCGPVDSTVHSQRGVLC